MRGHAWGSSPARFARIIRDLAFRYMKWDAHVGGACRILPESIVLSKRAHGEIVATAERFAAALREAEAPVRSDPLLLDRLGIDRRLAPLVGADPPGDLSFGRADFFLTESGRWVISEFNDDVPGGFNEAVGLAELLGPGEAGGEFAADLRGALVGAFGTHPRVGFVYATGYSEDLQHCAVVEKWLREAGHETVRGSPEQLAFSWRGARLAGTRIDAAFRFYPGEWLVSLDDLAAWERAAAELPMMNPLAQLVSQSKLSFALWREAGRFPEPALVERYLPFTERFDGAMPGRYRDGREGLVLKRAFGRMGDSVIVGSLATQAEWDAAVARAASRPAEWAIQDMFRVRALELPSGVCYPTVGAYVVGGRFAGYFSRVAPRPFITHEAYHVATVVETA